MVYTKAAVEVVLFDNEDIVTASVSQEELSALHFSSLEEALEALGFRATGDEGANHLRQMIDIWGTNGLVSDLAIYGDVWVRHRYCDRVGDAVQSSFSAEEEDDSFDSEW